MPTRIPTKVFLTRGNGTHRERLTSFEYALRDAGIASYNLVYVSSIFAPGAELISKEKGVEYLKGKEGGILYVVLSRAETDEANRQITSAIGLAVPKDNQTYGYISEHHTHKQNQKEAGDYAEDLAVEMLGSTLGLEVDVEKAYDEKLEEYKMSGKMIRTTSIAQGAVGKKDLWTTVISAAVFCDTELK